MKPRVVVTGFGPFENVEDNPSATLAKGCGKPHHIVDVSYVAAREFIDQLDGDTFDTLVLIGVHGRAETFQVEMVARNEFDSLPDVNGLVPTGSIRSDLPESIRGTLWPTMNLQSFLEANRAMVSFDAGGYLCNFIYFEALAKFRDKKVGFLHVPQAHAMSMSEQHAALMHLIEEIEQAEPTQSGP